MRKCRYCGRPGLRWVYTQEQGWRLHDGNLAHTCEQGLAAWRARQGDLPMSAEERYPSQYAKVMAQIYAPDSSPHTELRRPDTALRHTKELEFDDV